LLKLENPVELTEYIHTICLPSSEWIPVGTTCFIHGTHHGVFNHAIETVVTGKCNSINEHQYDICTSQEHVTTTECLKNWSGTLVCPDTTGSHYAVGIYHSGPDTCADPDTPNIPEVYSTVVSDTARDAIIKLIRGKSGDDDTVTDTSCDPNLGNHRCPLGLCLNSTRVFYFLRESALNWP
jgi:hypothetical protein